MGGSGMREHFVFWNADRFQLDYSRKPVLPEAGDDWNPTPRKADSELMLLELSTKPFGSLRDPSNVEGLTTRPPTKFPNREP